MTTVVNQEVGQVSAQSLIERAYTMIGYKAAGEALSGPDIADALGVLNGMLDAWNAQRLFIVTVNEVVATVAGGTASIGPGMEFGVPRPVRIENGAFARMNGVDYPIQWIDRETYARITLKTVQSSFPQYAYYDANLPTATIFFYPVPLVPIDVHLPLQQTLQQFLDPETAYFMAPGYKRALEYSLAEELSIGYRALDPNIARLGANARRAIRRTNVDVPQMNVDLPNVRFNIYSGL